MLINCTCNSNNKLKEKNNKRIIITIFLQVFSILFANAANIIYYDYMYVMCACLCGI